MTNSSNSSSYRGRFAPSPTGPLHFGSLIAAVGSYLQARTRSGEWLLRMEDVDTTRSMAGAADEILYALDDYGFEWDGELLYQSRRDETYEAVLQGLREQDRIYPCSCSRKEIQERIRNEGLLPGIYPGTCRERAPSAAARLAWRLRVDAIDVGFVDALQGEFHQQMDTEVGDFVLRRADGLYAYQLAVVVDDYLQGITEVVRGSDLLDNTPRQIFLQRLLRYPTPDYVHLPVAVNEQGQKLSKQTYAAPLERKRPGPALWRALAFLGQHPPHELDHAPTQDIWAWAMENWSLAQVPKQITLSEHCR